MARLMADPTFREQQWASRYDPHVEPVNRYVDEICDVGRGWAPYVAPMHGGIHARVLSILRDPGPATQRGRGSGFISTENDDPTAALMAELLESAGVAPDELLPWNAYPWYINKQPSGEQLGAGVETIAAVLQLVPKAKVVLLQGRDAGRAWKRLIRQQPDLALQRGLTVIETFHPSRQALWSPSPEVRESRAAQRRSAFQELANALG